MIRKYAEMIKKYADENGIKPEYLAALINKESSGVPNITGPRIPIDENGRSYYDRHVKNKSPYNIKGTDGKYLNPYYDITPPTGNPGNQVIWEQAYGLTQQMYTTALNTAQKLDINLYNSLVADYKQLYDSDINMRLGAKLLGDNYKEQITKGKTEIGAYFWALYYYQGAGPKRDNTYEPKIMSWANNPNIQYSKDSPLWKEALA